MIYHCSGQADGFDYTSLTRLNTIKDSVSGEQSLLDYVLEVARQLYGKDVPDRLVTELAACANASGAC